MIRYYFVLLMLFSSFMAGAANLSGNFKVTGAGGVGVEGVGVRLNGLEQLNYTDVEGNVTISVQKGLIYKVMLYPPEDIGSGITVIDNVIVNDSDSHIELPLQQTFKLVTHWKNLAGEPIESNKLRLQNSVGGTDIVYGHTDVNGESIFHLSAGVYDYHSAFVYQGAAIIDGLSIKNDRIDLYYYPSITLTEDVELDISVPLVKLTLQVTDPNGVGVKGYAVDIESRGSTSYGGKYNNGQVSIYNWSNGSLQKTDALGNYSTWVWHKLASSITLLPPEGSDFQQINLANVVANDLENTLNIVATVEDTIPPIIQAGPFTRSNSR